VLSSYDVLCMQAEEEHFYNQQQQQQQQLQQHYLQQLNRPPAPSKEATFESQLKQSVSQVLEVNYQRLQAL